MYLATEEVTRTFTFPAFLLSALNAVAFIVVMIWVKLALYRRNLAEDNEKARRLRKQRETHQAMPPLSRRHVSVAPSTRPLRFAAGHWASLDRERAKRERPAGATAKANGSPSDHRGHRPASPGSNSSNATLKTRKSNS